MEHDNLFIQILEILSIKHTEDFTIRYYERHPHKNNLFGLSEMLRYYNNVKEDNRLFGRFILMFEAAFRSP